MLTLGKINHALSFSLLMRLLGNAYLEVRDNWKFYGKNTRNKIKYPCLKFFTCFFFLECYISDKELELWGLPLTGRLVEPDTGQMECTKCSICPFNNSLARMTCHYKQGGGRKMSQFISKWLCNSRVLSSRDKGHPIILGQGIRISGKQAQAPSSPLKPPANKGSTLHKYTER